MGFVSTFQCQFHNLDPLLQKKNAEEKATAYAQENGLDLVVINPLVIMGRALNKAGSVNPSLEILERVIMGQFPAVFDFCWGIVDVEDVALAHVLAMTAPAAKGRYLCIAGTIMMKRMCHLLAQQFPKYKQWIPTAEFDNSLGTTFLKLGSFFESRDVGSYIRSNIGQVGAKYIFVCFPPGRILY